MKVFLKYMVCYMLSGVLFTACTTDGISQSVGVLPDESPMLDTGGQLCSTRSLSRDLVIQMYEGDDNTTEAIVYRLTRPASTNLSIKVAPDPELVAKFNEERNSKLVAFPIENVALANDGTLTIPVGKKASDTMSISFSSEGLESETNYLLPLSVVQTVNGIEMEESKQVIYYFVSFLKKQTTTAVLGMGEIEIPPLLKQAMTVCYVNTEEYKPLVVGALGLNGYPDTWERTDYYSVGHIVNLKKGTVEYDASSQRVSLSLGSDLSYVLENRNEYIRPLLYIDRKICICIENGGKGIGFCNMSDVQITDFVRQVKNVVERYQLDGVNLWDEDDKYKENGMPERNTTSYPKLIKSLKEAMPDKLLTLVDKGNATEYFYDVNQCGGIEVGRYIDYAWHGYCSPEERIQLITPNNEGTQAYSDYSRRPIAGLDEKKYGSLNFPCYSCKNMYDGIYNDIFYWRQKGYKKSDIFVISNVRANAYREWENAHKFPFDNIDYFIDNGAHPGEYPWEPGVITILPGTYLYMFANLDYRVENPINNFFEKDW